MSATEASEVYGKRLIPHVIDDAARNDPARECFSIPLSSNPRDGWRPVSYGQYAAAIDRLAHHIFKTSGAPEPKSFPTLAYIGANDATYLIFIVAAVKAGYKAISALLISPRNSEEAQLNLFALTGCDTLYHDATFQQPVLPWLAKRGSMKAHLLEPLDFWLAHEVAVEPFPYVKSPEEAEWEPFVVLHTSGSTGLPKPIVVPNGLMMLNDKLHLLPTWKGTESAVRGLARTRRNLTPMPFSHASGLYSFFGFHVYWGVPVTFAILNGPFTAEFVLEQLAHAGADVDSISLPPSVLEELSLTQEGCDRLKKLAFVVFGGGNLSDAAGQKLLDQGVVIQNSFGSTECGMLPYYWQTNPNAWQWLHINSDVMGAVWRPVAGEDDIFELVIVRHNSPSAIQGVFYTYPGLDEWSSKDLFKKHPTLPDHWKYHGRCDDLICFSNGEKLNPVTFENALNGHPKVGTAIVVGSMRFQPALLVEPAHYPANADEAERLVAELWPLVASVNKQTATYGQISRQLILLAKADKPFPRLVKDTVNRALSIKLYESEIEALYRDAEAGWKDAQHNLDLTSEETLIQCLCRLFQTLTRHTTVEPDTDLFTAGVDSLQVVNACRLLRGALATKTDRIDLKTVAPRLIYANPSPRRLAADLWARHAGSLQPFDADAEASRAMLALLAKYTLGLPSVPAPERPPARRTEQTVLLTGSTGRLGAHVLDYLVANPAVRKVICLNRARDGRARQLRLNAARGLKTDLACKTEFLQADLSQPQLGLSVADYRRMLGEADRVIHAQWPVNFNLPLGAFEPHVRGVRHLVDLCARAARDARLVLVSTVLAATPWNGSEGGTTVMSVPEGAYAQGKLVADLVAEEAARRSGTRAAVVRVGQIAGSEDAAGSWNRDEWLPRLVASSVRVLGVLPRDLGIMSTVNWVTAQGAARVVLEAAEVTGPDLGPERARAGSGGGVDYYYAVNPRPGHFSQLSGAMKEFYGGRVRDLVSWGQWVAALEASAERESEDGTENPALQLLDFFKGTPGEDALGEVRFTFSLDETLAASQSLREMQPITPELMVQWCRQWDF
ncbi:male sterility protein [Colletotrichum graminicola M1.001]|uniref:Male sterility protein n=1 Tax=Colletotrichum graminicola (strain M1.001 / M2 / FGSC 10212) TaxID=645133 RepID=E3R0J2_COLGM|nr:male sterility protein [Colletotrichum graminicola M1.001]EFQ36630.1 male sterility protein [Colletotrichum graminicola M1.001]